LLLVCGTIGCGEKKAAKEAVAAQVAQKECSQRLGLPVEITNSIGMKLKLIPAGEFMMGSPESDDTAGLYERPQHKVRITKPFYLGVYEVTQAEYEKVMEKNPSRPKGAANPVEQVSWDDATEFCRRLSSKEEKTYRLPTEAEWEYACRAGSTTLYSFGDAPASLGEFAWHGSDYRTHPVGEKKPNAWGLYDMHGNVCEWCADWYDSRYYANSPTDDPTGPEMATFRVYRGGSWGFSARLCRSAVRRRRSPEDGYHHLGIRVAADASGK